ncbi:MAG: carboxypeptidase-like regulatory domain-containing protein [Acidobacteria bacterium]|nr:carboxypeptidase-like regulatory domain-containing protein [Acidobacteriota bacterium]
MKKVPALFLWSWLAASCWSVMLARPLRSPVNENEYVGNVVGSVVDARTRQGISKATVILISQPWQSRSSLWTTDLRNRLIASSSRREETDSRGQFLINHVPTPYPFKAYTVVAVARGYGLQVFDYLPVLPGAVMSLECEFALTQGTAVTTVFRQGNRKPYRYSHERTLRIPSRSLPDWKDGRMVFATREGLVGRTTANGHVIRPRDRFVALPSRRSLSGKGGREFQVRLTHKGKSVVAPVWDIGPWNVRDDHWSPSSQRERWRDLPQGLPQAQAAFQDGYNGGQDEFGRQVKNPAGIDLADGVFWDDLRMRDNDWIRVDYLWTTSDNASGPAEQDPYPSPKEKRAPSRRSRVSSIFAEILRTAKVVLTGKSAGLNHARPQPDERVNAN